MPEWIDLRSDTVTQPTANMRKAMYDAEVGDDVYGEDPTVNELENLLADMLGKEAGLFVASGTQSNLIALLTHCQRGEEYIAGDLAHLYRFEGGGAAVLGGIQPQTLPFQADGTLDLAAVAAIIKPDDFHFARTRLLCLENTQSGKAGSTDYYNLARSLTDRHGLSLHLDGARYFNAVMAVGCEISAYAQCCHSVSICLSKGLGAPVGSVLVGDREFIAGARRWRKVVGGGMRQAGILAAAGLYALRENIERLREDHEHADRIARAVNERFPGSAQAHTNMVFVSVTNSELSRLTEHLATQHIRITRNRWVLHLGVSEADVDHIITALNTA